MMKRNLSDLIPLKEMLNVSVKLGNEATEAGRRYASGKKALVTIDDFKDTGYSVLIASYNVAFFVSTTKLVNYFINN